MVDQPQMHDIEANPDVMLEVFCALMEQQFIPSVSDVSSVAVSVSGGVDSMVLCYLLNRWAQGRSVHVHAITVDHRLRAESADEAQEVGSFLAAYNAITHKILEWRHEQVPASRIQEHAREARYALIGNEMRELNIRHLFVAHHQDDQAETFLFRLAKGSGLDGLAAMSQIQIFSDDRVLCRPLLGFSKDQLRAFAQAHEIPYVNDPSNRNEKFARVRLRQSMEILGREGLSAERLAVAASRMARARNALEQIAGTEFHKCADIKNPGCVVFDFVKFSVLPEEIGFRLVKKAIEKIGQSGRYGVRLGRIEKLFYDLVQPDPFRRRTLGGVIIERDDHRQKVVFTREPKHGKEV